MLFALLLPVFLLAGLGGLLAKTRLLSDGWHSGLSELAARLLIPAFLFSGSYRHGFPDSVSWQVLAAFFVPLVALFALVLYRAGRDAARALAATYSNTVFVGLPVIEQAFGPASLQYAYPVIAFHGLVVFALYYLAAPGGAGILRALLAALKNPIVVSLLLGLSLNASGLALPQALGGVLALLSAAALPCALLALGAALAGFALTGLGVTLAVCGVKLLLLPAAVLAVAALGVRLPASATAVLVILASCPVGINAAALVQADGKSAAIVNSAVLLSSLLCMLTIPMWIALARTL